MISVDNSLPKSKLGCFPQAARTQYYILGKEVAFTYDLLESELKLLNDYHYHVFHVFHVFPKCAAIL